ncbi:amino acid transporter [Rhizobium sp. Root149]|uniref:LysE/ArgO family amino acid transporter n=1 Tax=Rhizobium TaxID=379 RepID=UPI0007135DF5|nr:MULTISPECIES: LysE/ArgO family amino acid transporter [Rhizobium]KQZ54551.1 amino acid transporter [Rhizobium sp. Root149]
MITTAYTTGFSIGLSLIVAIGAQNAFVLRQGLRNEHVLAVALTCALSDALLIFFGVSGFQQILASAPWIDPVMRYAGAAFLLWYGARSLHSAVTGSSSLVITEGAGLPFSTVISTCLAFTWLNPHVYLDTVVLVGTLSTRFPGEELIFAAGASTASLVFFFSLAYGATYLRPLFAKPSAWRLLDTCIALIMWTIAATLLFEV